MKINKFQEGNMIPQGQEMMQEQIDPALLQQLVQAQGNGAPPVSDHSFADEQEMITAKYDQLIMPLEKELEKVTKKIENIKKELEENPSDEIKKNELSRLESKVSSLEQQIDAYEQQEAQEVAQLRGRVEQVGNAIDENKAENPEQYGMDEEEVAGNETMQNMEGNEPQIEQIDPAMLQQLMQGQSQMMQLGGNPFNRMGQEKEFSFFNDFDSVPEEITILPKNGRTPSFYFVDTNINDINSKNKREELGSEPFIPRYIDIKTDTNIPVQWNPDNKENNFNVDDYLKNYTGFETNINPDEQSYISTSIETPTFKQKLKNAIDYINKNITPEKIGNITNAISIGTDLAQAIDNSYKIRQENYLNNIPTGNPYWKLYNDTNQEYLAAKRENSLMNNLDKIRNNRSLNLPNLSSNPIIAQQQRYINSLAANDAAIKNEQTSLARLNAIEQQYKPLLKEFGIKASERDIDNQENRRLKLDNFYRGLNALRNTQYSLFNNAINTANKWLTDKDKEFLLSNEYKQAYNLWLKSKGLNQGTETNPTTSNNSKENGN